jgi:signal-transduction protein with cAMP-binding, CBS, and nucleotidyltransferase domain
LKFAPEEWIYRTGEVANEMYLVASGTVDELGEKDKVFARVIGMKLNYGVRYR